MKPDNLRKSQGANSGDEVSTDEDTWRVPCRIRVLFVSTRAMRYEK